MDFVRLIEVALKADCPYDTGALFRSINVFETGTLEVTIRMNDYGYIQNSPQGQHTGWIDRAVAPYRGVVDIQFEEIGT